MDENYVSVYARRIKDVRKARELRWFHDMAEDENSALYTCNDIEQLIEIFNRVHEIFFKPSEE